MPLTSTYVNNATKNALATDVGFKISKPGYDARTTAGNNLVFSSSWPSLPIAFQKTIANPLVGGVTSYTVAHNLKFPPFTEVWAYGPDPSGVGNTSWRFFMSVDSTNVYLDSTVFTNEQNAFLGTATKINIKCFQLDLTQDIDYILAPGDTFNSPYDPNFGIKVALPNKDITSTDLRNFAVHSRCQSPLVLAVKTQATSSPSNPTVVQYQSSYKYPVWVYGFVKNSNGHFQYAPYYAQAYPKTMTDGSLSYLQYIAPDIGATLVILRDPMFAATSVTVNY